MDKFKSKKKILLIHHSGLMGGAGLSLYNTWIELNKHYDVVCYIPDDPGELLNFLRSKGLFPKTFNYRLGKITYYSGGNGLLNPKFWYHSLRILFHKNRWINIIKHEKPDLVILNAIVLCWFSLILKKFKSIIFVRETVRGSRSSFMNVIMSKLLDKFTLVSFLSNYDKDIWSLVKAKSVVTHDFMEYESFTQLSSKYKSSQDLKLNPNTFNVVFVGGINRIKGSKIIVNAFKYLKSENINLIIAGNNPGLLSFGSFSEFINSIIHFKSKYYHHNIINIIKKNSLTNKITYIGVQNDIRKVFDASDLLVIPMVEAHQARPVFEFGCQKKPIIITNFSNIKEFVKNGFNGLTFNVGDDLDLAKNIKTLYSNNLLYRNLGNNNHLNSIKNHKRNVVMGKLLKDIASVI